MGKNRQLYIEEFWQPYPASEAPEQAGRLISMEIRGASLSVRVWKNFKEQLFEASPFIKGTELNWQYVLEPGDLIEVNQSQISLLVPTKKYWSTNPCFSQKRAEEWQSFLAQIHSYFKSESFLHIDTPSLVDSPGMEVFLEAFETEIRSSGSQKKVYLPTSPEFHLKKALCAGFEKIYEVAKVFRNNEDSPLHQLEFWMLEWYRAYDKLDSIKEDAKELIQNFYEQAISWEEKSFAQVFKEYLGYTITPTTSLEDLRTLAKNQNIDFLAEDDFNDLFFRIYVEKIEPKLQEIPWLVLHSFPPSQAALAKKNKEGWANRFEIYCHGIELANAFDELNDFQEQRNRFVESQREKSTKDLEQFPLEEDFLEALAYGMPPSSGIALGLDRLFMVIHGLKKIEETRLFPR